MSEEAHPGQGDDDTGPSWVDRILAAIRQLPGPSWLAYGIATGVLFIASHGVAWLDGTLDPGTLDSYRASLAVYAVVSLAGLDYFTGIATGALGRFRVLLGPSEWLVLEREFTRIPGRPALAWASAMVIFTITYLVLGPDPASLIREHPLTFTFDTLMSIISFPAAGVWAYAVIRQLRLVARAHASADAIDLFRPDPLYAFSGLTARAGGALLALTYLSAATDPSTFSNPALAFLTGGMIMLSVACFVLPLLGMRQRIVEEKARLESRAGAAMRRTLEELDRRVAAGDDEGAGALAPVLSALVIERDTVARIRTWPWRVETLRGFISAVVLPIGLWLTFRILERLLG